MGNTVRKSAQMSPACNIQKLTHKKALEGKDVKDLLLNVGSGGNAAAPAAGGAGGGGGGTGGATEEAPKEEEKEEGENVLISVNVIDADFPFRERGVR